MYRLSFIIATVEYPQPIRITVGIPEELALILKMTRPLGVKMIIDENKFFEAGLTKGDLPLVDYTGHINKGGEK